MATETGDLLQPLLDSLRAENARLRGELVAERSAETTRRTGLEDVCATRCEHGGFCTEAPGHDGEHDASGFCGWSS